MVQLTCITLRHGFAQVSFPKLLGRCKLKYILLGFSYDLQKLSILNVEQSNDTVTPLKWVQIQYFWPLGIYVFYLAKHQ